MKILIATEDHSNRALAVLAFKNLNAANFIDFVTTTDELMDYLILRTEFGYELPDLLLYGLTVNGKDIISEIKANEKLSKLKVVTFSIHSYSDNKGLHLNNLKGQTLSVSSTDELSWILNEICDGLMANEGWQYSISRPLRTAER